MQAQQNAVSIAQQTASQAAAQVAKDASAVADAQQRLDALKNNGSNDNVTATAQLQSTISQLQKQLANDKQAAQNAQQMLESAQQNYDHATAAQKAAEEKVNQTKAALAKAQQAVTTAQANATAAQQKVATAKADALKALETYNNYKNDNGVPTVKTPSDIVQQYESYINGNRYNSPQVKSDCAEGIALNGGDPAKGLMAAGWTSTDGGKTWTPILKTNYQATDQDKAEKVDPRNMTAAQQTEITKFAAQIVNSFRDSFQSTAAGAAHSYGKVKVSPYATELGNQVIDGAYNNSGWNKSNNATGSPHNENGMVAAANDNMMAGFNDPYDNYYDLQQEAASIPSAPLEGYTRQLSGGKINAKLEAAIKSGQIKLPSSNTKSEAKKQPKVNKDSLTAMTVVAAGAALATGASLNKKRKNKVAKKLEDNE